MIFDRFAIRGSLPAKKYDFYCPQMGGEPKRENYLRSSCIDRQKQNTCDDKNCKHRLARYERPRRRRRKSHQPYKHTESPNKKIEQPQIKVPNSTRTKKSKKKGKAVRQIVGSDRSE